jgi:uncharacterized tellurite resistance protein B-like protein
MKSTDFEKFLFHSAIYVMAIDGEIHNDEIEEIKLLMKQSSYFFDFDFDKEKESIVNNIDKSKDKSINTYLDILSNSKLNERQEFVLLEVFLKIIEADKKVLESEIHLLKLVISRLNLSEKMLLVKFPKLAEYLIDFKTNNSISSYDIDLDKD